MIQSCFSDFLMGKSEAQGQTQGRRQELNNHGAMAAALRKPIS